MVEVLDTLNGDLFAYVMQNDDIKVLETGATWSKVSFVYHGYEGWVKNEHITDINPRPVTLTEFEQKLIGEWIIPDSNTWDKRLLSIRDNKTLEDEILYYEIKP